MILVLFYLCCSNFIGSHRENFVYVVPTFSPEAIEYLGKHSVIVHRFVGYVLVYFFIFFIFFVSLNGHFLFQFQSASGKVRNAPFKFTIPVVNYVISRKSWLRMNVKQIFHRQSTL